MRSVDAGLLPATVNQCFRKWVLLTTHISPSDFVAKIVTTMRRESLNKNGGNILGKKIKKLKAHFRIISF